jgi:hypothetical protein
MTDNADEESDRLLRTSSFLDPRYKGFVFINDDSLKEATETDVREMALRLAEKSGEAMSLLTAEKEKRDEKARKDAPQVTDDDVCAKLGGIPVKQSGKMKMAELRRACEVRGLGIGGLKADLQERLAKYTPQMGKPSAGTDMPKRAEAPFGAQALLGGPDADVIADVSDGLLTLSSDIKKQVKRYKAELPIDWDSSPLEWWKRKQSLYPLLAPLARDLLAMPGSTCALERAFSKAGLIYSDRRRRLDPKVGSAILFCHELIRAGLL